MAESLQFNTAELREDPRFAAMFASEPGHELPDVTITPYDGKEVSNRANRRGHEIIVEGEHVGTFTLVGRVDAERRYAFYTHIEPEFLGKRVAVAMYVGLIAILGESGKHMTSDPMHLNEGSHRIWESLRRRGLAQIDEGAGLDKFGFPRYVSSRPHVSPEAEAKG